MKRILAVLAVLGLCLWVPLGSAAAKPTKKSKSKPTDLLIDDSVSPISEAEMALTEVPYAKGAPAVVLLEAFQKQWDNREFQTETYVRRTKILTQDGVETYGDFTRYQPIRYRVKEVLARTILPDGTVLDASADVQEEKSRKGMAAVTVAFPQVQVGAILEVIIRYNTNDEFVYPWIVQEPIPVLESRFILAPKAELRFNTILAGLPPEDNKPLSVRRLKDTAFVWRFFDVPAISDEPHLPPIDDIAKQLFVILSSYESARVSMPIAADWKSWNKRVSENWNAWISFDDSSAKNLARNVVTKGMSVLQKAEAVRAAVHARIQVDWIHDWPRHETPDEVLKKGSGNSSDAAGLAVAMLRSVGVEAVPAAIRRRSDGSIPFDFPIPARLNDTLVRVTTPGGYAFFSPSSDAPVGALRYDFTGILAFPYDGKATEPVILPDFTAEQNQYIRTVQGTLDSSGSLTAESIHVFRGIAAGIWLGRLTDVKDEDIRKLLQDYIREGVEGAEVTQVDLESAADSYDELILRCTWNAPNFATVAGKRLILNPRLFNRITVADWANETRQSPIHLGSSYQARDTVRLKLPDNVDAIDLPAGLKFAVEGAGIYEMRLRNEGGQLVADRTMRLDNASFPASVYPTIRKWMSKIAESDDSPVVLTLK